MHPSTRVSMSGVDAEDFVDAFLHEIVCTRTVKFAIFHQWHPHGASQTCDLDIREELFNLQIVASGTNCALGSHDAYMSRMSDVAQGFHGGAYHTQHSFVGSKGREVVLLNGAQCLCRSGVTS